MIHGEIHHDEPYEEFFYELLGFRKGHDEKIDAGLQGDCWIESRSETEREAFSITIYDHTKEGGWE